MLIIFLIVVANIKILAQNNEADQFRKIELKVIEDEYKKMTENMML